MASLALCLAVAGLGAGCGVDLGPFDDSDVHGGGGEAGTDGSTSEGTAGNDGSAGAGGADIDGPAVTIRFRSNTDTFEHADGLSGQTPLAHSSGVRKLQLLTGPSDADPYTVFDFGQDYVEISYDDGADTPVYVVAASTLPERTFTVARVVHSHVRYRVRSTMHTNGLDLLGEYDCMQVLSDGTMLDGQLRDHGYFEYLFESGAWQVPLTGTGAPVPEWAETGGFVAGLDNGEWSYTFAIDLYVTPHVAEDVTIVLEVNMHDSFRWQDQAGPGYQPGVFDTQPFELEPVMHFGANDYELYLE